MEGQKDKLLSINIFIFLIGAVCFALNVQLNWNINQRMIDHSVLCLSNYMSHTFHCTIVPFTDRRLQVGK